MDDVGMAVRVLSEKDIEFLPELVEFLLQLIELSSFRARWRGDGGSWSRWRRRDHRDRLDALHGFDLIPGPDLALPVDAELIGDAFELLAVRFHLCGEFVVVLPLELTNFALLLLERGLDVGELRADELGHAFRLTLTDLCIFVDVVGGQRVGYRRHRLGVWPVVFDGKGSHAGSIESDRLHLDVVPHAFDQRVGGELRSALRIKVKLADEVVEPGSAEDLLAERLQTGVGGAGDRGLGDVWRDLLTDDAHGGDGLVDFREYERRGRGDRKHGGEAENSYPLPPFPDSDQLRDAFTSANFIGHCSVPPRFRACYGTRTMSPPWRKKFSCCPAATLS